MTMISILKTVIVFGMSRARFFRVAEAFCTGSGWRGGGGPAGVSGVLGNLRRSWETGCNSDSMAEKARLRTMLNATE